MHKQVQKGNLTHTHRFKSLLSQGGVPNKPQEKGKKRKAKGKSRWAR